MYLLKIYTTSQSCYASLNTALSSPFPEVPRVLKPGGAHIFTVPYCKSTNTLVRAAQTTEGIKYLTEKRYHGNPIDPQGALVVNILGL